MQRAMGDKVKGYTKGAPSNDYAGLASHFVELAGRKVRTDGTIALVLPLSAMSGKRWEGIRRQFRNEYQDIVVVTIAGEGDFDKSFSQDTGMADEIIENGPGALLGGHPYLVPLPRRGLRHAHPKRRVTGAHGRPTQAPSEALHNLIVVPA